MKTTSVFAALQLKLEIHLNEIGDEIGGDSKLHHCRTLGSETEFMFVKQMVDLTVSHDVISYDPFKDLTSDNRDGNGSVVDRRRTGSFVFENRRNKGSFPRGRNGGQAQR